MEQETAINPTLSELPTHPQEPIVLNPGLAQQPAKTALKSGRGVVSTFGILIAGWFFGNLILLAIGSVGLAVAAGSTGLVRVPLVSERFFGTPVSSEITVDQIALENAEEKLNTISTLPQGETLKSVALDEGEVNALLQKQIGEGSSFPIAEPKIKLGTNEFVFSGKLAETNAPLEIVGRISVSGLVANVEIMSAKFGKVEMPSFVASNLLESYLEEIGLSLGSSQIPAKSIQITDGIISLLQVSKIQ